jgi:hypothetical protein
LLKGDLGFFEHDRFIDMILVASQQDFYFSHRVWFFMEANLLTEQQASQKVLNCLKQVSMHQETKEIFYLANSTDYISSLYKLNMIPLYPILQDYLCSVKELRPFL